MKNTTKIELILVALLPILLVGLAATSNAETQGASIVSATGTAPDGNAYPGEPITVTLQVNFASAYTVSLVNDTNGDTVWAQQIINPPSAGTYTVTLTLPLSLPNLSATPVVYVNVTGFMTNVATSLKVYPKIVITPIQTGVVDQNGNPINATVNIYGATPGSSVSALNFTGPISATYNFSTPILIGPDGTGSANLTLAGSNSGFASTTTVGLPRGTYNVTFAAGGYSGLYAGNESAGTINILPVLLINPNDGSGMDSDLSSISLTGYSFDPNVVISGVNFTNTNFTNVYYYFDFTTLSSSVTTNTSGFWTFSNLAQVFMTNMTAGLYTLYVNETTTTLSFPNTYYLVRPILIVTPTTALPGQTVTINAYGYGPGAAWGYSDKNTLTVSLDRTIILATVTLGKDGNLTFQVTLPSSNIPFGAHYIWGRDAWGYEYSAAIIIGSKGYYEIVNPVTGLPKTVNNAYAGYNNATLTVCPCGQYTGLKFCDQCAVYNGGCDYVGDQISVTLNGLTPGETVNIYFGNILVNTTTADSNGAASATFVVPTVPQGSYYITATGPYFGTITLQFYNTTTFLDNTPVNVVPKLLLLDLNSNIAPVLVGPGIVRVIGTGFTPGVSILSALFNGTDAVMALTTNVQRWTANANGVLVSPFTSTLGLYIPVLEPGAYAISFAYAVGTQVSSTDPGYVYVINNLTELATIMDVQNAAASITNAVNTAASGLSNQLSSVSSQLTTLQNNLNSAVSNLNSAINSVGNAVSSLQNSVSSVASSVTALGNQLSTLSSNVNSLSSQLNSVATAVNSLGSKVDAAASAAQSAATNAQNAANSANAAASAANALSSKIDSAVSAAQNAASAASNASSAAADASSKASSALWVSVITLVLVLVAIAISYMVYSTFKKSLAPTPAPAPAKQ